MTLRERVIALVKNGGYDIIPGIRVIEKSGDIVPYSANKRIWEVVFSDEENDFKEKFFEGRVLELSSEMIIPLEKIPTVSVGIVEHRTGDCLGYNDLDCECPVCTQGWSLEVEFRYTRPCILTDLNKKIYTDLRSVLNVNSNDMVVPAIISKYKETTDMELDRTMKIVTIENYPFSKMVYASERTRGFEVLCNPDMCYTEEEFIKQAFMLAYDRVVESNN